MNLAKMFSDYDTNACDSYDAKNPCKKDWIHKFSVANYGLDFDLRATVDISLSVKRYDLPDIVLLPSSCFQK